MPESEINIKQELCDNVLPLFEGLVDALQEGLEADVADLEEAVDELMDASTDVLHPETAAKIAGTIEFGKQVALELEQLVKKQKVDDVTKKRILGLVAMFRQGAEVSLGILQEITIPLDDVPPDDDEDDGDDDDGEDVPAQPGDPDNDDDEAAASGEEG